MYYLKNCRVVFVAKLLFATLPLWEWRVHYWPRHGGIFKWGVSHYGDMVFNILFTDRGIERVSCVHMVILGGLARRGGSIGADSLRVTYTID